MQANIPNPLKTTYDINTLRYLTFVEEIYILLEILTSLAIAYIRYLHVHDVPHAEHVQLVVNVWAKIMAKRVL